MNKQYPLISCICITKDKPAMLQRAITCFKAQLYPKKELIILYEENDAATSQFLGNRNQHEKENIRSLKVSASPGQTLGELRNIAIEHASGEFICQWDDDDWYHNDRLQTQYNELHRNNRNGAILTQWIVYDAVNQNAYISNRRIWEGSILCKKDILQLMPYKNSPIGEDTPTIDFLMENDHLHPINEHPGLYIYIYHGKNTWNFNHWNHIFQCSNKLPDDDTIHITDILEGAYTPDESANLINGIMHRYYTLTTRQITEK